MKRALIIIAIVVGAALLIAGGVYLRLRGAAPPAEPPAAAPAAGGLPSAPEGGSADTAGGAGGLPLANATVSSGQVIEYFAGPDGRILTVRPDGQIASIGASSSTLLSTTKVAGLIDAWFSADGKKLLVEAGDTSSPQWSVYDIATNSWRVLPISARDVRWSPQDQRVAFFARRTNNTTLTVLDLAKAASQPQALLSLAAEDLDLTWASSAQIFFGERASAGVPGSVWAFDLTSKTARLLLADVNGATLGWGKERGLLFRSRPTGSGGILALVDGSLGSIRNFSFLTLPAKCSFYAVGGGASFENLVCGVPRDARELAAAALPDDYERRSLLTADSISVIDLANGSIIPVFADAAAAIDVYRPRVAGADLYFINRWDSTLYKLPLPKEATVPPEAGD